MATIIDIKTDREPPKNGDKVDLFTVDASDDEITITKEGDIRVFMRLRITAEEKILLIRRFFK